jgi:hypothetical protein
MKPYLIVTHSTGIFAFQTPTRERVEKLDAIVKRHDNMEMFKMVMSDNEANIVKWAIKQKKFMYAAYYITKLRLQRGDFVE